MTCCVSHSDFLVQHRAGFEPRQCKLFKRWHHTNLTSVKSDILERLAEAIFYYTAYPNDAQRSAVAQALVEKHPCLKEPGSFIGC